MHKNVIFTISSLNYLVYDMHVRETFLKYNPGWDFVIYLIDKIPNIKVFNDVQELRKTVDIRFIDEQSDFVPFLDFSMKYNVYEFNVAVKPFIFQHLFNSGVERAIYIDPDVAFYNKISVLEECLDSNDIVLTPHVKRYEEISDDSKLSVPLERLLQAGIYNLGFIAIKNTNNAKRCLKFWAEMLASKGFLSPQEGLFCDQKWCDVFPLFFDKVCILKDDGYNVSAWNLHEITISRRQNIYYANDSKLVFYHFSGWKRDCSESVDVYLKNRKISNVSQSLKDLLGDYQKSICRYAIEDFVGISFFYDKYPLPNNHCFDKKYFYNKQIPIRNIFYENCVLGDVISALSRQLNKKRKFIKGIKVKMYIQRLLQNQRCWGFNFYVDGQENCCKLRKLMSGSGVAYILHNINDDCGIKNSAIYSDTLVVSDNELNLQSNIKVMNTKTLCSLEKVEDLLQFFK